MTQAPPQTATVVLRHQLARAVPARVTHFRCTGFDAGGGVVFEQTVPKAAEVILTVPVTLLKLRIEYLAGITVVGSEERTLALSPGGTVSLDIDSNSFLPALTAITVLAVGDTNLFPAGKLQLQAVGTLDDQTQQDVTELVTWSSSQPAQAEVSETGLVTGVAPGTVTITASLTRDGITASGTLDVTVTPVTILSLALSSLTSLGDLPAGLGSAQLMVVATLSDQTTRDVTGQVTWTVAPESLGTVSSTGLFSAGKSGTGTVVASLAGVDSNALTATVTLRLRISVDSSGAQGLGGTVGAHRSGMSADGRFAVFSSDMTNLVPNDLNGVGDCFVHDRLTRQTTRISVSSAGVEGDAFSGGHVVGPVEQEDISDDGSLAVFASTATNLLGPGGDTNGVADIFLRNLSGGTTTRVSLSSAGLPGNGISSNGVISGNGGFVAFVSAADNLLGAGGDTNGRLDTFVRDLSTNQTTRVSQGTGGVEQTGGDSERLNPYLTPDGRFVCFVSSATGGLTATDTNGAFDVFLHDRQTGVTTCVSLNMAGTDTGGGASTSVVGHNVTDDGRFVVFDSLAGDLVAGDGNGVRDVFMRDTTTGVTTRISRSFQNLELAAASDRPSISGDGRFICFRSAATNVVPNDTNGVSDIFVFDRVTGTSTRVSLSESGAQVFTAAGECVLSRDGRWIMVQYSDTTLVANDNNGLRDVFVLPNLAFP